MITLKDYINESIVNEGFWNSLFGTGRSVDTFLQKLKSIIRTLNREEPDTIFGKLSPNDFKYDEKVKNIIYVGDAEFSTGVSKNKPLFPGVKIPKQLSNKEYEKLEALLAKSKFGKAAYKYGREHQNEIKKQEEELKKKQANDPEYNAKALVKYADNIYNHNESDSEWPDLIKGALKIIGNWKDNKKFVKAYEKLYKENRVKGGWDTFDKFRSYIKEKDSKL